MSTDKKKRLKQLRTRAESVIRDMNGKDSENTLTDVKELIHELNVHQVELEIQNEQLRETQLELEKSREKYSSLFDLTPVGYFTLNKKGKIVEHNFTGAEMLRAKKTQLAGKPFSDFVAKGYRESYYEHFGDVVELKVKQTCELRLRKKDGGCLDVQMESTATLDAGGDCDGVLTTVTDMSQRIRAEEADRKNARLNQMLLDSLPHPAMIIGKDMKIIVMNREAHDMGGALEDYCWHTFGQFKLLAEDDREYLQKTGGHVEQGPRCTFCLAEQSLSESRNLSSLGIEAFGSIWDIFWVPLDDEKFLHYAIDITERMRAEQALHDSEERYRSLFEASPDSVVIMGIDGAIKNCNAATLELTGMTREEITGNHFSEVFMPVNENLPKYTELFSTMNSGDIPSVVHAEIINRNGEHRRLECNVAEIKKDGDVVALQVISRDITGRIHAEEEIRDLAKFPHEDPFPTLRVSTDGVVLYANPASRNLLSEWLIDVGDEVPTDWQQILASAVESAAPVVLERKIKDKHFSIHVTPVLKADYINIYTNDVTLLKKAEKQLKEYRDRLEEIVATRTEELRGALNELSMKQERLSEAQRIGRMGNWEWNLVTGEIHWSDEIYRIFGLKPQETEITFEKFIELVHPDDMEKVKKTMNGVQDDRTISDTYNNEYRIVLPGGEVRNIRAHVQVFRDETGMVFRKVGTAQDITERKRAEASLSKMVRMQRMLSECIEMVAHANNEETLLADICRLIVETGGYRLAWIGYAESDEHKSVRPVAQYGFAEGYVKNAGITWADNERGSGPAGTAIKTGLPGIARNISEDPAFEPWRNAAIERGYESALCLPLVNDRGVFGALNIYSAEPDAFMHEERRLLEKLADNLAYGIKGLQIWALKNDSDAALKEREQQLERLSRKVITSQEEERSSLARNLHDALGQRLAAMSLDLDLLKKKHGAGEESIQRLHEMIGNINEELQNIYKGLRPVALEKMGLEAALETLVWEYRNRSDFQLKASIKPIQCKLDSVKEITIYRIVQESLTNIARHSEASQASISLRSENSQIVLEVTDDGKGFDSGAKSAGAGFGIVGMKERAALCGGMLEVKSSPGQGAQIKACIPILENQENLTQ